MKTIASNKKQQKKKLLLTVISVSAAGVLGYFGWQYWKKKKATAAGDNRTDEKETVPDSTASSSRSNSFPMTDTIINKTKTSTRKPKTESNEFPLRKGSSGDKVAQLQTILNSKYKAGLTVDGKFGAKTEAALKKIGKALAVSESLFNVLTQGANTATQSSGSLGKDLVNAVFARDYKKTLAILKRMKNTDDYTEANNEFKQYRLVNGVRQTLVNGLLNSFSSAPQQEAIRYELLRMGLQYDGNKWSLSGLDGLPIVTLVPATVWINAYKGVKVPARTVLGNEVCRRLDYTLFQNKGKYFLVQTNCIKHL